ncbi:TPA: hypothetical protein ACJYE5_000528 [Neisseria gonorrhoeae]
MPTLSEKHEVLSGLNRQDAAAIVALIDLKTEDDMEKVLNKLDFMIQNFDARLDAFEKSVDARISSFENSVDARFSAIDTKINAIYWFIGITTTVAVAAAKFL